MIRNIASFIALAALGGIVGELAARALRNLLDGTCELDEDMHEAIVMNNIIESLDDNVCYSEIH